MKIIWFKINFFLCVCKMFDHKTIMMCISVYGKYSDANYCKIDLIFKSAEIIWITNIKLFSKVKKAVASGMQRYSLTYFLEYYYNDTINIAITFVKLNRLKRLKMRFE